MGEYIYAALLLPDRLSPLGVKVATGYYDPTAQNLLMPAVLAGALLFTLPAVLAFFVLQKRLARGIVTTGLKGEVAGIELQTVVKVFPNGVRAVDGVDLTIEDGEFMVLVGPSGCGKTTLLRCIAGLEEVTDGAILIGDRDVTDVPPKHRDIAMVFQNYALYPHMTVRRNRLRPEGAANAAEEIAKRIEETARLLGLEDLMDRRPLALSGGQRQRVAMGRAIARRPAVYLMDEPLSNLDAKLRVRVRADLARLHSQLGVTTVYVTHDQVEAMTLGQRAAVMNEGKIQQVDTPQRLYWSPVNLFVAAFIGSPSMNLVDAHVADGFLRFAGFSSRSPSSALTGRSFRSA